MGRLVSFLTHQRHRSAKRGCGGSSRFDQRRSDESSIRPVGRPRPTDVKRSLWTAGLFNADRRVRIGSPRNENIGGTLQHRLVPLIAQEDSGANDSPIGFGLRLAFLRNRRFEIELITRAYRVRQFQLIPAYSRKDMESWLKPGRQQNEDREGMGAG